MVVPCEENPLPVEEVEIDEFQFHYTTNEKPHIQNVRRTAVAPTLMLADTDRSVLKTAKRSRQRGLARGETYRSFGQLILPWRIACVVPLMRPSFPARRTRSLSTTGSATTT